MSRRIWAFVVLAALPLAASVRKMTLDEMTRESVGIVRGTVQELRARWSGESSIVTDVILDVQQVYRGGLARGELTLTILGGRIGDREVHATEMAHFAKGEEVVVFLSASPYGLWPMAGFSGKYSVQRLRRGRAPGAAAIVVGVPEGPIPRDVPLAELERVLARAGK